MEHDRLLFLASGIFACLRAVQHSLKYHDRRLSPEHRVAIDEWFKRTPMDGKEISFIKKSRDFISKRGRFREALAFALRSSTPTGPCAALRSAGKRTILLRVSIAISLTTCAPPPIGAKSNCRRSSPRFLPLIFPAIGPESGHRAGVPRCAPTPVTQRSLSFGIAACDPDFLSPYPGSRSPLIRHLPKQLPGALLSRTGLPRTPRPGHDNFS
jgi:hypothetical protein